MKAYILGHTIEYLLVYVIFGTGVLALFSSNDPFTKIVVIGGLVSVYFIWVIWHHLDDHKKLEFGVFMEYVAIIVLVGWILISLI